MNRTRNRDESLSLDDVARRLNNRRITKVARGYQERSASLRRIFLAGFILAWTVFWCFQPPTAHAGSSLWLEARHLLPWSIGLFVASVLWWAFLAVRTGHNRLWMDVVGTVGTYLGIWILLHNGWNIAISLITFLPLVTIVAGTRFGPRAFWGGMVLSIFLLAIAPPMSYWVARPAFIPFALILLIGLPLTVIRLLNALHEISATAVISRDAQSRMTAMVSHELRTPLNTICNASHLIETAALPADTRDLLESVSANADALLYRVNQVLDLAAIDNKRLHLSAEPFLVANLVRTVHDVIGTRASDKRVRFTSVVDPRTPKALLGDTGRIEQVISNLVSNAIKFTPRGGKVLLTIEPGARATGSDRASLRIRVADSGIGIPDNQKASIFSPFFQVSSGLDRTSEGVGLGLHIVKGVSDSMRGTLSVQDNAGGGTVFTWDVELPVAASEEIKTASTHVLEALKAHSEAFEAMRCLVVDDNPPNRDIMRRILTKAGHQVNLASDGNEGLLALTQTKFDVIFLDLHMPHLSGVDVLKHIKAMGIAGQVVVLSADSDPDVIATIMDAGARAYLLKPVSPLKVLDTLEDMGTRAEPKIEPAGNQEQEAEAESALEVIRQMGDGDALTGYLGVLLQEIKEALSRIDIAAKFGSHVDLAALLHGLRNTLGNAGESAIMVECESVRLAVASGHDAALTLRQLKLSVLQVKLRLEEQLKLRLTHTTRTEAHG